MAIQVKNFLTKFLEGAQTTQYTVPAGSTVIIDKVTGTNQDVVNCDVSVNLVTSGDTPNLSNLITQTRTIAPSETYTFPELVGQVLEAGDYFSTLTSVGSAVTIRISGREIT